AVRRRLRFVRYSSRDSFAWVHPPVRFAIFAAALPVAGARSVPLIVTAIGSVEPDFASLGIATKNLSFTLSRPLSSRGPLVGVVAVPAVTTYVRPIAVAALGLLTSHSSRVRCPGPTSSIGSAHAIASTAPCFVRSSVTRRLTLIAVEFWAVTSATIVGDISDASVGDGI